MKRTVLFVMLLALVGCAPAAASGWTTRADPVLTATEPWERGAIFEPTVIHEDGVFKMWYSGGWDQCATGYATSTDGLHWTKYAGNPVLPAVACRNSIVRTMTGYRIFYSDGIGAGHDRIWTRESPDGIHFGSPQLALDPPAWASGLANSHVWEENGHWRILFDARVGDTWQMGLAEGSSPTQFTHARRILELNLDGAYGAPWVARTEAGYSVYYLASTSGEMLPSDIFVSHTTDFHKFTRPELVLSRFGWAVDQIADPTIVSLEDGDMMFFDGDDNPRAFAAIGVATLPIAPWQCHRAC